MEEYQWDYEPLVKAVVQRSADLSQRLTGYLERAEVDTSPHERACLAEAPAPRRACSRCRRGRPVEDREAEGGPMSKPLTPLGIAMRQRRRELDLNQAQLGEQLGVAQQSVAKWETGDTRPRRKAQIEKLAEFLELDYRDAAALVLEDGQGEGLVAKVLQDVIVRVERLEELVGASGVTRQ